jgi:hypothetical protein
MSDTRTLREKLAAMAQADESPHEAAIARAKLAEMGESPPPPRRPTTTGPAAADWFGCQWCNFPWPHVHAMSKWSTATVSTTASNSTFSATFRWNG